MAKNYHKFELTRKEDPTSVTELMRITQKRAEDLGARARLHIKDGSNYLIVGFSEAFNHLKAGKQLYLVSGEERELKQNPTGAHKRTAAVAQFNQEKIQSRLFPELDPTTLNERAKSLGSFRSLLSQTSITPASSERIFPTEPAQETIRARVIGMSQTGDIKTQRRVLMEAYQEILSSIDGGEELSEKIQTPEDLIGLIDGMKIGEDYDSDINRKAFKGLVENASIYELLKNANQPFLTQLLPHMKNLAGMPESKLAEMLMPTPSELIKPNMRLIIHTPELTIKQLADGRGRFQKYKDYWFRKKVNLTEFQDSENETYRQAIMLINKTGSRRNAAQAISEAAAKLMERVKRPGKIGLELVNDEDDNPVAIPWVKIDGELLPRRTGDDKDAEEVAKKLANLETGSHKAVIRIGKSNCFLIAVTNEGMPKNLPNTFDKRWMIPTMHVLADQEQISFVDFLFIVAGRAKSLYDYTLKSEDIKTIFILFTKLQDLRTLLEEEQAELDRREKARTKLVKEINERQDLLNKRRKRLEIIKAKNELADKSIVDELKKIRKKAKTIRNQKAELEGQEKTTAEQEQKIKDNEAKIKSLKAKKEELEQEKKALNKETSRVSRIASKILQFTSEKDLKSKSSKEIQESLEEQDKLLEDASQAVEEFKADANDDDDNDEAWDLLRADVKPRIMAPKLLLEDNFDQETIEWLRSKKERSSTPEDTGNWKYLLLELEGDRIVGLGHNEREAELALSGVGELAESFSTFTPGISGDLVFYKDEGGLKYKFDDTFVNKLQEFPDADEFIFAYQGEVKSVAMPETLDEGDWFKKQARHDDALGFYKEWKNLVQLNASRRDDESERGTVKKNPQGEFDHLHPDFQKGLIKESAQRWADELNAKRKKGEPKWFITEDGGVWFVTTNKPKKNPPYDTQKQRPKPKSPIEKFKIWAEIHLDGKMDKALRGKGDGINNDSIRFPKGSEGYRVFMNDLPQIIHGGTAYGPFMEYYDKEGKIEALLKKLYNRPISIWRDTGYMGSEDTVVLSPKTPNPLSNPVIKATSLQKAKDLKEKTLQDHQIEMFIMKKGKSYLLVDKRNINKALQKGYTMAEKTTTGIRSGEDYDPEWKHALARGETGLSRTLAKAQAETRAKKLNKTVYCEKRTDGKWYVVEAKPKGEHFVIQPNPAEKKYHCALCKRNGKRRVLRKANKAGTKLHCIHCGGKYELHDKR